MPWAGSITGTNHPSWPHCSSAVSGSCSVGIFAGLGVPPDGLYAKASGAGTLGIIVVMFATSVAVVAYFVKRRGSRRSPPVCRCGRRSSLRPSPRSDLGGVTYLAVTNYSDLLGDTGAITASLPGRHLRNSGSSDISMQVSCASRNLMSINGSGASSSDLSRVA